ncbi:hypothetical protein [Bacillus infantis]|uniref:hypothetical protein n=1 Tax=Bacillus infantis TaxID=324767 RepID=UPI003CF4026C
MKTMTMSFLNLNALSFDSNLSAQDVRILLATAVNTELVLTSPTGEKFKLEVGEIFSEETTGYEADTGVEIIEDIHC